MALGIAALHADVRLLSQKVDALAHELQRLDEHTLKFQKSVLTGLACLEKVVEKLMATFQDVKDALAQQNAAILQEITEINAKLDEALQNPARLQEIVDQVKANTQAVVDIVNTPVPDPGPTPAGRKP